MRQSGATYLPADCCFSELATKRVRLVQSGRHKNVTCSRHDISEKIAQIKMVV